MRRLVCAVSVCAVCALCACAICAAHAAAEVGEPPMPPGWNGCIDINADEAHEMLTETPSQVILLDIRTASEHEEEHISIEGVESAHIPLSELRQMSADEIEENLNRSKVIIVYCQSGRRSRSACEILTQHNFTAYNLAGGINAWKEAGYPTTASTPPVTTPAHTTPHHSPTPSSPAPLTPTSTPETPLPPTTAQKTPAASLPTAETPSPSPSIPGYHIVAAFIAVFVTIWRCARMRWRG